MNTKPALPQQILYRSQFQNRKSSPDGWTTSTPREEVAPQFALDGSVGGWEDEKAALSVRLPAVDGGQGKWVRVIRGIEGGATYRVTARCRAEGVESPRASLYMRLLWLNADGQHLKHEQQEYFPSSGRVPDGWKTITGTRRAPADARKAELQLVTVWAPGARVWWSGIELARCEQMPPRQVTIASVYLRPKSPSTTQRNIEMFCSMIDEAGKAEADVCVLPEAMTLISVPGGRPQDVAEPIPGPISKRLGEHAARWKMYVVACYPERVGANIYNTAVLIGRDGAVVGKYRKTHLPNEEVDAGYTPGNEYPVFQTDFGKVGMMICWDVSFPEPARALALKGAQVLLMPIWGGHETLMAARALENAVYLVSSSYDAPTGIIDPLGKWINVVRPKDAGVAPDKGALAIAKIDLNEAKRWSWVGDFSRRLHIERRPDLADVLATDAPQNDPGN